MHIFTDFFNMLYGQFGNSLLFILGFIVLISLVAQMALFAKAEQPWWAALVPVLNVLVFLRIVGRPSKHIFLFLIPVYGQLYLIPKVWIELAQSFGKQTTLDYVLIILLNGLYIFTLGLSYETKYVGPAYGKHFPLPDPKHSARPSLA